MKKRTGLSALTAMCVLGLASMASAATLNSNQTSVTLQASAPESLTVALTGNSVNFGNVTPGLTNATADTVQVTTSWKLKAGHNAVNVYAYFTDGTKALANLTDPTNNPNIPSSAVKISGGSLAGWNAVSSSSANAAGFGGASAGLTLSTTTIDATNRNSSINPTYSFQLDLTGGSLPQLPADSYSGTMYIEAQATP